MTHRSRPLSLPGLLIAAGSVAAAGTLIGFLGPLHWALDLFSHFRFQYLIGLIGISALLGLLRRRKATIAFLLLGLLNAVPLAPLFFGRPTPPATTSPILRGMLFNVNTRAGDPERVLATVKDANPDFVLLEEISRSWLTDLTPLHVDYPYQISRPRPDNFGIALFSKHPLPHAEIQWIGDEHLPSIVATITTPQGSLHVLGTHPLPPMGAHHTQARNAQLAALPQHIDASRPTLLLGDLNTTPWNYTFKRLARETGLRDSSRGFGFQPTWPHNLYPLRIPLDHALVSEHLHILDRSLAPYAGSDHRALILDFSLNSPDK